MVVISPQQDLQGPSLDELVIWTSKWEASPRAYRLKCKYINARVITVMNSSGDRYISVCVILYMDIRQSYVGNEVGWLKIWGSRMFSIDPDFYYQREGIYT